MKLTALGTGGGVPSLYRGLPAFALERKGEVFLFDCGEGTQFRIMRSQIKPGKLQKIFISHFHGDHILGLTGLLMTLSQFSREKPLELYGPPGIKKFIEDMKRHLNFRLDYELIINEVTGGEIFRNKEYSISAMPLSHIIFNLAYKIEETERPGKFYPDKAIKLGVKPGPLFKQLQNGKSVELPDGRIVYPQEVTGPKRRGRKIVYATDTNPIDEMVEFAMYADLLMHDGMFAEEDGEMAIERGHSSVKDAANIAKRAKVKRLMLIHISPRYGDGEILLEKARVIFPNTIIARDYTTLEIPYED